MQVRLWLGGAAVAALASLASAEEPARPPRPPQPLFRAYGCREVLGAGAPFRQVAWVCRKADVEDRRHGAVIAALEEAYAALGQSGS